MWRPIKNIKFNPCHHDVYICPTTSCEPLDFYFWQLCVWLPTYSGDKLRHILHSFYIVHSRAKGKGFRTCKQGQWWVPMWHGCYGGWAMLWRSFTGTTSVSTEPVYSMFSAQAPLVLDSASTLTMIMMMIIVGQIFWQNRHQNHGGCSLLSCLQMSVVHTFTGGSEVPHQWQLYYT
jgi:hypothetical protein